GRGRPFFLFRLRARADLSFAFWPGGIKNACLFASLIISSVITLRLKRRKALSIDSPGLIVTTAIYFSKVLSRSLNPSARESLIKHVGQCQGQAGTGNPANSSAPPAGFSAKA